MKILSPGRSSETHLGSPPVSPSATSIQSFDGLATSATNVTTDVKRGILKEPSIRTSLEEDSETKFNGSGIQRQVNI